MNISSVSAASQVGEIGSTTETLQKVASQSAGAAEAPDVPFANLVQGLLSDANSQHSEVQANMEKLVTGEIDSVHDVVLAAARADLAFQMVMEVRDRVISSYQDVMRMQV